MKKEDFARVFLRAWDRIRNATGKAVGLRRSLRG
jgi:hypothetical protein